MADGRSPGLVVRATPLGVVSFSFVYRCPAHPRRPQRRVTLNRLPRDPARHAEALADARARAAALEAEVAAGRDPMAPRAGGPTVDELIDLYIEREARPSIKTWAQVKRTLRNHLSPALGARAAAEVTRDDLFEIIDGLVTDGRLGAAGNVRKSASRLFRFAVERGILQASPAAFLRIGALRKRDDAGRELSDPEIVAVWRAMGEERTPWREYGRLLLLTGQRRAEIANLAWSEVDERERLVTIPPERHKTGAGHVVPLSDAAWEILVDLPRWGDCDWILSLDGEAPVRGFGRFKRRLDLAAARHLGRDLARWRLHDLRVTVRSGLSRLGVRDEVCEAVIGHVPSHLRRTYNKYRFLDERREALQAWARHVTGLAARG